MNNFIEQLKEKNYTLFVKGFVAGVITALVVWIYFSLLNNIF